MPRLYSGIQIGVTMNKKPLTLLLITIVFTGLIIAAALQFGTAQTGTSFNGIISSDTTWTKANSPYTLNGPVSVAQGVTLTIEPGVIVQSPGSGPYTIEVNGTMRAIGTITDKIEFNKITSITFTTVSKGYDEKTGTGSIIQNSIVDYSPIGLQSPAKVDHNILTGGIVMSAVVGGNCGVISNNTITAAYGDGVSAGGNLSVTDNVITGAPWGGIDVYSGSPTIQRNLVTGNMGWTGVMSQGGIVVRYGGTDNNPIAPLIEDNTVTNNNAGITIGYSYQPSDIIVPIIRNNNIYGNQKYNFYLDKSPYNVSLGANWWGTTDQQAIAQTIYDYHNNYNLGNVSFTPFLTAAVATAPSTELNPNPTPTPTPSPTATPSPTPTATPTPAATATPTPQPTINPTTPPTATPTNAPAQTTNPTSTPTKTPTVSPTPMIISTPTASPPLTSTSSDMPVTAIVIAVVAVCIVIGVFAFSKIRKKN